jgi:hypothetical protein
LDAERVYYGQSAQWEAGTKDRLITFLHEEYGYSYVTTGEDVVSDPKTGKNSDYELSPEEANLPAAPSPKSLFAKSALSSS